jgi:hypothetical protein
MGRLGELFELLAHRAPFDLLAPLATMFVGLPPSSSDLTERKGVVPPSPPAYSSPLGLVLAALARFLLGDRRREHRESAAVVVVRKGKNASAPSSSVRRRAISDARS